MATTERFMPVPPLRRPGGVPRPASTWLALAEPLDEVYQHSHAVQVDADERCTVKTPGGSVTADHVVVATHSPFLDRALAFARVSQQRYGPPCTGWRRSRSNPDLTRCRCPGG